MSKKVVIAGGTGFVGQYLCKRFQDDGFEVIIVSRQKGHVSWENSILLTSALNNADILINLAGKAINTRFTSQNKIELIRSRVESTKILGKALLTCSHPPKLWLNASGAHIYGAQDLYQHTEKDALDNTFFPAVMAQEWENALNSFELKDTRKIALRISIVLGKNGGVLRPFVLLTKFFLGGTQGSGLQKFSWIHLEDFYQIMLFAYVNESLEGPINLAAPELVDNRQLMKSLRKVLQRPFGIPAPEFVIKIGASVLGIEPDLILKSLSVYPQKLIESGYHFKFAKLDEALEDILKHQ